ncbi:HAD family hydrolase [Halosegnis sp.]|uniref:HAD family hydrolase n=1 Tax=Halosegnis sp. TaxID=2864959 RepID=UPI0035D4D93A
MELRAVGFDLDDTLAVTERPRSALLAAATDRVDAPPLSRRDYLAAHDRYSDATTREPVFAALLEDRDTETDPAALAAAYRSVLAESLTPVGDVAGLLAALGDRYRLGLLTDGPVGTQRGKLNQLGWSKLFDVILATGGLAAPKPDARAFGALVDGLDVPAATVAYVGDHPQKDVVGARVAGLVPIQVCYDGGPDAHPQAAATVRRARLVEELPGVLASL